MVTSRQQRRILGSLIGAIVGDAAGVTLEFYIGEFTLKKVNKAMHMPGGGRFHVGRGQPSDDSELLLALASVIKDGVFDIEKIRAAYREWYNSEPFDVGQTCARAFGNCRDGLDINMHSEANGALMRVMPIPCFFHKLPYEQIADYARCDAALSHPNQICQDVNALYSIAIAYLINNPGDHIGACKLVSGWPNIHPTVKQWIKESKLDLSTFNCEDNIGHVKHAFKLALYFLRHNTTYEDAIRQTLMLGRTDTDTNCAIVGGLIGALHGYSSIPAYMKDPVLAFDPTRIDFSVDTIGRKRPALYRPANILVWVASAFYTKKDL
jgi:ADP-ribosylglycohydrolase